VRFRWLGTAGFEIEVGSSTILLDPFLSRPNDARPRSPLTLADIAKADQIFLSHGHYDHAVDVPALVARTRARVYAPSPVCEMLLNRGVDPKQLRPLAGIETLGFTDYRVRTIPSRHIKFDTTLLASTVLRAWRAIPSLSRAARWPVGGTLGFLFTAPDCSWSFFGSAGYYPDRVQSLRPDIALIPVQGHSDIARIAAELVHLQEPAWVVPQHHDDFLPPLSQLVDLAPFVALVGERSPISRVVVPEIGRWLRYAHGNLAPEATPRGAS
jgi:L-ascorbate metabolism protein UlaG (beta-lactamase superfamily)